MPPTCCISPNKLNAARLERGATLRKSTTYASKKTYLSTDPCAAQLRVPIPATSTNLIPNLRLQTSIFTYNPVRALNSYMRSYKPDAQELSMPIAATKSEEALSLGQTQARRAQVFSIASKIPDSTPATEIKSSTNEFLGLEALKSKISPDVISSESLKASNQTLESLFDYITEKSSALSSTDKQLLIGALKNSLRFAMDGIISGTYEGLDSTDKKFHLISKLLKFIDPERKLNGTDALISEIRLSIAKERQTLASKILTFDMSAGKQQKLSQHFEEISKYRTQSIASSLCPNFDTIESAVTWLGNAKLTFSATLKEIFMRLQASHRLANYLTSPEQGIEEFEAFKDFIQKFCGADPISHEHWTEIIAIRKKHIEKNSILTTDEKNTLIASWNEMIKK